MVAISSGARVYLDANIVIYFVEAFPEYLQRVEALFYAVAAADGILVSSALTLAETLVKPLRDNRADIVQAYEGFLTGGEIELLAVDRNTLKQAAALRAFHRLKLPDAIHVATALASNCHFFVSNDDGIQLPEGILLLKI